jgi:hypothetical protein
LIFSFSKFKEPFKGSEVQGSGLKKKNWNNGMLELWPPARRAYASERMMALNKPVFTPWRRLRLCEPEAITPCGSSRKGL